MKLIFGLGNPGTEYDHTRHNIGFLVVDELAWRLDASFRLYKKEEALVAEATQAGEPIILVKPQTFMNLVGRSLKRLLAKTNMTPANVLVVHDDADLPFGTIRYRESGSAAGHHGMESVLGLFAKGTPIRRLRIGIGRPTDEKISLDQWVLSRWSKDERVQLPNLIAQAADRVLEKL